MADDPRTEEVEELETGSEADEADEIDTEETGDELDTEEEAEEVEEDEGEQEAEEQPARQSRGANLRHRAQEAERNAREAREKAERLEREIEELRRGRQPTGPTPEEIERERARLELMTPEERAEYRVTQAENRLRGELQRTQFALADQNDKAAYEAKAATNPIYARYADRVEAELRKLRAQGQTVFREALLSYLIGQDALKRGGEAGKRQRKRADTVRQRETTRPRASGRSDTPAQRGKPGKTARERLEDVTF